MIFVSAFKTLFVSALLALLLCNLNQASADYMVPKPIEQYNVVLDHWRLVKANDGWNLQCVYNGKSHTWSVNQFILADRLDGNAICAGNYKQMTESYLSALSDLKTDIEAELVADKKGGPVNVAGLWSLGEIPKYKEVFRKVKPVDKATQDKIIAATQQAFVAIGSR